MEWDEDESESRVVGHDSGSARQGAPSYLLAEESVTQDRNGSSKNAKNLWPKTKTDLPATSTCGLDFVVALPESPSSISICKGLD